MKDILDKYVSITKFSLKEMKRSYKPSITKRILKSVNQKIEFTGNLLEPKNVHSKAIYHLEFKRCKSMINRLTRINKSKYYKKFLVNTSQILSKLGKL